MTQKPHRNTEKTVESPPSVFPRPASHDGRGGLWRFPPHHLADPPRLVADCGSVVGERGAALGMAVMIALTTAIGAYALLVTSLNQARQGTGNADRIRARDAAEAGLVWAQQRLFADATYCGTPDPPPVGGFSVDVTVSNCGAGNIHQIDARVTY